MMEHHQKYQHEYEGRTLKQTNKNQFRPRDKNKEILQYMNENQILPDRQKENSNNEIEGLETKITMNC